MNKIKKIFQNEYLQLIVLILSITFIGCLFFYITKCTPLAGDDWGYALNGMQASPLAKAFEFYQTWSGRFFSELWGFVVAPRKWLWNILNPLLFTVIFVFVILNSIKESDNLILVCIGAIFLMLSAPTELRMETYTWIMGTTYVVPLCFGMIVFFIAIKGLLNYKNFPILLTIISILLCFYIGLTMENMAAVMVFGELMLLGYDYFENRKINISLIILMITSLASFLIMRASPGSTFRLERDHAIWNAQPLYLKLLGNMEEFIEYSFIQNKYLISTLSFVLASLSVIKCFKKRIVVSLISVIFYGISVFMAFGTSIANILNSELIRSLTNSSSYLAWGFWIFFVLYTLWLVWFLFDNKEIRCKIVFFILLGGAANVIMMFSPIFGSRSSLYFYYFVSIATMIVLQELDTTNYYLETLLLLAFCIQIFRKTKEYYYKYSAVAELEIERQSILEYYRYNSNIKEVHIWRMPPDTVHGADIEEDDTYHMETFKEYYGLANDSTIIFEWKDEY